jgi:hypothetical protein
MAEDTRRERVARAAVDLAPSGPVGATTTVLAAIAAFYGQIETARLWHWVGGVATFVAAAVPSWVALAQRSRKLDAQDYAEEVLAAFQVVTARVLAPIAERLAELEGSSQAARTAQRAVLIQKIVYAAEELARESGAAEPRVVLYKLGSASRPQDRTLTRVEVHGRQNTPRDSFRRDDIMRPRILQQIDSGSAVCVRDTLDLDQTYYRDSTYRTFIAAPVSAGSKAIGLLSIDATEAGSLPPHFQGLVRVLASFLALVMS